MQKSSKKHLINTAALAGLAVSGQTLTYNIARASSGQQVKVETVQLNFQQETTIATKSQSPSYSDAAAKTLGVQNQFIFLLALTVLGLVGIAGLIRDFRKR